MMIRSTLFKLRLRRSVWRQLVSDDSVVNQDSSSPGEKWNWVRPAQGDEQKNELVISPKPGYTIIPSMSHFIYSCSSERILLTSLEIQDALSQQKAEDVLILPLKKVHRVSSLLSFS